MAKCQMCGAEVKIGQHCEYCGSMAEPYYYPLYTRLKEKIFPEKTPQQSRQPPENLQAGEQIYTVVRGDNLWSIAKRFYGNGPEYIRIVRANPQIKNPNVIYPGQKIIIPK